MVFVIINTDVERVFHPYSVPAETCIGFSKDRFFHCLKLQNRGMYHLACLTISEFCSVLLQGMEDRFLLHGSLGKTQF